MELEETTFTGTVASKTDCITGAPVTVTEARGALEVGRRGATP